MSIDISYLFHIYPQGMGGMPGMQGNMQQGMQGGYNNGQMGGMGQFGGMGYHGGQMQMQGGMGMQGIGAAAHAGHGQDADDAAGHGAWATSDDGRAWHGTPVHEQHADPSGGTQHQHADAHGPPWKNVWRSGSTLSIPKPSHVHGSEETPDSDGLQPGSDGHGSQWWRPVHDQRAIPQRAAGWLPHGTPPQHGWWTWTRVLRDAPWHAWSTWHEWTWRNGR